jgi:2-polyprenyl-6-methoxyphenol hydroxylase-like FAD-dependent oxidoreductase
MATQRRAVIVGAGIAGLATAIALQQAGWRVALLERGERLRGDGTAVGLQPNGIRALRSLGLGLPLDAISTPLNSGLLRRPDGKAIASASVSEVAERFGSRPVAVRRDDLFESLVSALGDQVQVHTGITATHIDLVHPAAGDSSRRWPADLIVGADGINSALRPGIDPAAKVVSGGRVAYRAVIPAHRVPDIADEGGETHGPDGRRFSYAPLGPRGASWYATVRGGPRPESVSKRHQLIADWFGDWHAPIPQLIAATRPEEVLQQQISYLHPLPQRYTMIGESAGAVLVGDAAHAMNPDLAQGAALALEDAVTLGASLTHHSISQGLREYEQQRHSRTAKLAKAAQRMGAVLGARGRMGSTVRNGILRAAPETWFSKGTMAGSDWLPPRAG